MASPVAALRLTAAQKAAFGSYFKRHQKGVNACIFVAVNEHLNTFHLHAS